MKKILFSILCSLMVLMVFSQQHSLVKVWETDSLMEVPESVLPDYKNKVLYVSNINGKDAWGKNRGSIGKVGLDGKIILVEWVGGLHAPKGMGLYKNNLYVADLTEVVVIDANARTHPFPHFWEQTFGSGRALGGSAKRQQRRKGVNLQELIENIGEEGDFTSKMRESLVSIGRVVAFMQAIIDQLRQSKDMKENRARIKILQRDIVSLTDHASFLSAKISFLLDAVLGLISIEQNGIIKIFSVAAVVFLPPTLVASIYGMNFHEMPELAWTYGYPFAIGLMILSAILPFWYFKQKGWL